MIPRLVTSSAVCRGLGLHKSSTVFPQLSLMASSSSKQKGTTAKRQKSARNYYASQKDELEPEYFSSPTRATSLGLPAEILQTILRDAFRDACEPLKYNWRSIRIPSHVCRYWRRLVLHDTTFWTRIFIPELSPAAVESFIRRSGSASLEVHIHLTDVSYTKKSVKTSVKAIFGEAHRFRTLWLDVEMKNVSARMPMETYLRQYLRSPNFTLEDLRMSMLIRDRIYSRARGYLEIPDTLFGPELRNVFLQGVAVFDAIPYLTNLTRLTLSCVHHLSMLSDVLDILEACPKLLFLEFNHSPMQGRICSRDLRKGRIIELPFLRTLYLHLPFSVLEGLLQRLQIPTDITWGLQCHVQYNDWQAIFLSETLQSFVSLRSQATSVVLYTSTDRLGLEFYHNEDNSGESCFFQVRGLTSASPQETLERMDTLGRSLGFSEVRKLSVWFEHRISVVTLVIQNPAEGYLDTLSSLFPNVRHLSLIRFEGNKVLLELLKALKTTRSNAANSTPMKISFSKLQRLDILGPSGPTLTSNDSFVPELLSCLDARENAGMPIQTVTLAEESKDPDAVLQLGDRVTWVGGEDEKVIANIRKRLL